MSKKIKFMVKMMTTFWKRLAPIFLMLIAFSFIEGGMLADYADARSKSGGKSFSSSPSKAPASTAPAAGPKKDSSFSRGLMGGLLGGALGGMLFGSMFGGSGIGILPLLLLAGVAFFLYKKFAKARPSGYQSPNPSPHQYQSTNTYGGGTHSSFQPPPPPPPVIGANLVEEGIDQIRQYDRDFDPAYFKEVASDVFFQVQAGWMRRDLDSYRHLLGDQLAREYEQHFAEMRANGQINKLESIAVRSVEIVAAGSDGREDFVTLQFTANLLDYTVDDKSGELISGSMTTPVKFQEDWTWARPAGTQNWKLEGIKES